MYKPSKNVVVAVQCRFDWSYIKWMALNKKLDMKKNAYISATPKRTATFLYVQFSFAAIELSNLIKYIWYADDDGLKIDFEIMENCQF